MFDEWKTFVLAMFAMAITFFGVYLNMFDPSLFTDALYAGLGAYGLRTAAKKIGEGMKGKE